MDNTFLSWLDNWQNNLPTTSFSELGKPETIALVSVDMIVGFCHKGPLASEQVKNIISPVVDVFEKAHAYGVKHFLMFQDAHKENAEEFGAFPPHCIKGTEEAENIPELARLPFASEFITFEKNAWSPAYDTKLNEWISSHPEVTTFILVGDCTDICVYSAAMHLRMQANALHIKRTILIPANAVATYDMSVDKAKEIGAMPHSAYLLHQIFLYHMALSAITVLDHIS